jgi:2-C-methyl-D-erythritol 4-phosphate cytidylyltransferase
MKASLILVAGGIGSRMRSGVPKQFLPLQGKPIALHSLEVFLSLDEISEVVIVCQPYFQECFSNLHTKVPVRFALPGEHRQDSVQNGLAQVKNVEGLVCIHDSARPFVDREMIQRAIHAATQHGAAVVGMPVKPTIKQSHGEHFVKGTLDRSQLWEIQTPQVVRYDLLKRGFEFALANHLSVTDDVSLVEAMSLPVKLVEGAYSNLKITTPDDLQFAEWLLSP